MGYGGNRQDAGRALGKSGDGGIDGIINEDRLGLDVIYIQAKRWRVRSVVPKSKNSLVHCKDSVLEKAYSLQPHLLLKRQKSMLHL